MFISSLFNRSSILNGAKSLITPLFMAKLSIDGTLKILTFLLLKKLNSEFLFFWLSLFVVIII